MIVLQFLSCDIVLTPSTPINCSPQVQRRVEEEKEVSYVYSYNL